ncbi:uncharacterized protein STEHIDRAFT_124155 [Stereum hirsutum FP-91666 SS1]|uniref:uncharacterized protein n=1 Tax=Stereum hirsutum (strain FP-91666) TaxID=721885 RepID=UPI0004449DDF|nr:uncharacterized protein STEHIDRAFT_124155 [Stereum hirsutum FP-91666 SS1]EIM82818.1 hypothetical protein STEHIDRAFT_124155 [Stereum hirsutum FP-91666 SS1]
MSHTAYMEARSSKDELETITMSRVRTSAGPVLLGSQVQSSCRSQRIRDASIAFGTRVA